MNELIASSLSMLGMPAKDKVTGFDGMVSSITFDAYGCVQALITPRYTDNKFADAMWFDVKRVAVSGERVLPAPNFGLVFGEERGGNSLPVVRCNPVPR